MPRTHVGHLLNILGPSCREHKRLSVWTDLTNNLANLRLETHVKHTVSFVKDKVSHTTEVRLLSFQHIDETTRGCNDDFNTALKVTNLGALRGTTVDCCVADARIGSRMMIFVRDRIAT